MIREDLLLKSTYMLINVNGLHWQQTILHLSTS